jgi:transposase
MVDFRKCHDGLAALVKNELRKDLFTGTVFVFRSKRADRLKLLYWDDKTLERHWSERQCRMGTSWLASGWRNTPSRGQLSKMG